MPQSIDVSGTALISELTGIRRDLHAHPELGFREHRTSDLIAEYLLGLGLSVHRGIGGTGVVGVLSCGHAGRSVALRADMDALPIREATGLAYASRQDGVFHGCGHDGHVAMLLGAAATLARGPDFDGTVNFVFQPAEEGLGGAKAMIEDGLFERFPSDRVFAIHNWPGLPAGTVATRPGPIMAAADKFEIRIEGQGGHAAQPHTADDVIGAAMHVVTQLKTLVALKAPASAMAILSVTRMAAGHTHNVLPALAVIGGTVRTFDPSIQDRLEEALRRTARGVAQMTGTSSHVEYDRYYPATINDADSARDVIAAVESFSHVLVPKEPALTSEDFAFMLQARKGAYVWLGQARDAGPSAALHDPKYDFNDAIIPDGVAVHVALARHALKAAV